MPTKVDVDDVRLLLALLVDDDGPEPDAACPVGDVPL